MKKHLSLSLSHQTVVVKLEVLRLVLINIKYFSMYVYLKKSKMFQMLNSRELLKKALNIFYLLRPEDSNSVFGNFVSCTA